MSKTEVPETPWHDEQWLREKYHREGLNQQEIADICGITNQSIQYWVDKHDIERRDPSVIHSRYGVPAATFITDVDSGYELWQSKREGEIFRVYVHRLLAVAEFGFDTVSDNEVHHLNGIEWDNRHENIEVCSKGQHGQIHAEERRRDEKGRFAADQAALRDYEDGGEGDA